MRPEILRHFRGRAFVALVWSALAAPGVQAATYTLGTSSLLMGPTGGSNSIVLAATPATATWTAHANAAWLHVPADFATGKGNTNVIFVCDANVGSTREGTLSIGGQTLNVTQAGSTYIPVQRPTTLASQIYPTALTVDENGNVYFAAGWTVGEWTAASDTVTLLETNLDFPGGIAVNSSGDVYFSTQTNGIKLWTAATGKVTTLIPPTDFVVPAQLCLDDTGHLYILDPGNNAIMKWTLASDTLTTVLAEGLATPLGLTLDKADNLYVDPNLTDALDRVAPSNGDLSLLASLVSIDPDGITGLAVDGSGNIYTGAAYDYGGMQRWSAVTKTVSKIPAPGIKLARAFALDAINNLYIADSDNNAILELPNAYIDPTPKVEGSQGGADALPTTVPASANMLAPFTPTSDQPWLTITSVSNGVVSFSFDANSSSAGRLAHINLLGESVPVVQVANGPPDVLMPLQYQAGVPFAFAFGDSRNTNFTVFSSSDALSWNVIGAMSNIAANTYEFVDPRASNQTSLFYRVATGSALSGH